MGYKITAYCATIYETDGKFRITVTYHYIDGKNFNEGIDNRFQAETDVFDTFNDAKDALLTAMPQMQFTGASKDGKYQHYYYTL